MTAAAAGNVVFFQRFRGGIRGHRVEIDIDRIAAWQPGVTDFVEPGCHEADAGPAIDTRTVTGQVRALGHHVQTGKERQALIADQIHDMALAFLANLVDAIDACKTAAAVL